MKKYLLLSACVISTAVNAQSLIDNCIGGAFTITQIANATNQVTAPRDLEFKPNTDELWVVNKASNNANRLMPRQITKPHSVVVSVTPLLA